MSKRLCAALIFGGVGAYAISARTQGSPGGSTEVLVVPASCDKLPWSTRAWVELLRVELAADGIGVRFSDEAGASSEGPRVLLDAAPCDESATSATLTFSAGEARRTRTIQLTDIEPVARPRALAIAMADLVRSGFTAAKASPPPTQPAPPQELDVRARTEAPPVPPRQPPAAPQQPPPSPRSVELFVAGDARDFVSGNAGLFGGRAGVQIPLLSWLSWGVDAGVLTVTGHDRLGDIQGTIATLGTNVLGTGGAGNFSFGVGPRLEAGIGWFQGYAMAPSTIASSATSPLVFFAMSAVAWFHIHGPLAGFVGLDAGTSLYGFSAKADERRVSDLMGLMLSARIGFLWGFPR